MLPARSGTARLLLQIDMGLADAVWPAPQPCAYPALLDFPAPEVLAYPREAVVAEKLETMIVIGDRNSRIKDFFDLHHLEAASSSTGPPWPRRSAGPLSGGAPRFQPRAQSASRARTGTIRRGQPRCALSRVARVLHSPAIRAPSSCPCSARSCCLSSTICEAARLATANGLREVLGNEAAPLRTAGDIVRERLDLAVPQGTAMPDRLPASLAHGRRSPPPGEGSRRGRRALVCVSRDGGGRRRRDRGDRCRRPRIPRPRAGGRRCHPSA